MRFFSFRGRCFIRASFYFLAAVSVASAAATNNADDYLLQTWQSENGLPYQVVNNVLQDRDGYIWLATQGALVRFDGVRFKEYSSPLIGNERAFNIRAMIQEDESTLLMAPDVGGLVRLRDGKFTPHPASKDLAPEHISTLFAERGGALWIGYYGGDLVRWEKGKMKSFGTSDGLKAGQWSSLAYDSSGRLWVANGTFLGCYTNGTLARVADNLGDRICITPGRSGGIWIASNTRLWRWENGKLSLVSRSPPWAGVPRVRAMFEDRNGNLWIGTSARGLFRFSSGKFQPVATSHPSINAICEDHERNLWVATHGGGLNRLRPRIFQIHDKKTGLLDNISYSVCEGSRGDLWIGNCDGGLARLHGDQLEILTERTNWPRLRVFSVCADSHRGVWIGTRTGLYFWQSDSNEIPREMETNVLRDIHVLYRDQNGDVWVGADPGVLGFFHNGTFKRYTAPDGFPDENVRAIEEDKSGRVWVGTEDGNLFERIGEKFVRFGVSDGLPGSAIRAMWSDSQGVIWIGTSGGGLIAREGNRFKRITKTQGLPDNSIFQILVDDRDRVWFGSPRGIFHIGRDELLDCIE
ncbi:MAG TPA: two-component regulator propeller domain-containing protein, partial [Verrucomicrobiae bacterium]|nr:two-component regulator propeller domain-containing protein [Verrucomicrobiae bacterium]